ncbi:hypothetical protein WJX82_007510 [Trebouxia sp. C0006]
MRLRIKTFDGRLERINVEDNSTLGDLQKQVAGVFPTLGPGEVKLSLNKKVEVDGAGQDLLRTAGICGGDTLWILSNVPDEKESSQSDRHSRTASASKALQPPQQFSQAAEQPSSQAAEQQTTQQVSASSQKMQEAHKVDMQQLEQAQQTPDITISSAPDLLQRVLDSCTTVLQSWHQLLLLTLHAVLLETGMQLTSQEKMYALPDEALAKCSSVSSSDGSRISTLNVSLEQHLHLQQTGCNSGEAVSSFKNLQQLWTELKDGLALKMLAGLRQSAGLSPPLGLLALPAELKTKILASLQAKDLSAVECCCTELRHTASSNLFWQPLFQQEFGSVTSYESMQAGRLGWQGIFTQKWVERDRMRRQPRRNPRLAPFPMRGSFAPPGPPGIITGGDYDRLPQPFLGSTPGMFGGVLGGSGFGGQGPSASLFLGGNRGTGRAARAAGSFRLS